MFLSENRDCLSGSEDALDLGQLLRDETRHLLKLYRQTRRCGKKGAARGEEVGKHQRAFGNLVTP